MNAEILRFCLLLLLASLFGAWIGHIWAAITLALIAHIARLYFQIYRLQNWIHNSRRTSAADSTELKGLWAGVAYDVQLMLLRHEKEKQHLQSVVSRVRDMTQALNDAVILIDKRGNIEWWNLAAQQLFDFREVDRGQKLTNLVRHPKFIHYFDAMQYEAPLELTQWRKGIQLEFHVHVFGNGERLVIARDTTRLFKLEQMRKDFVANVSHELRTPLTVIRGYVETLSDAVPAPWQRALSQMEQQCKRMTLLIDDLITLSKLETDQKETFKTPVPLAPMLRDIASDCQALSTGKDIEIVISGDTDLALIGNERELRSAFSNLVVNAINYSVQGAKVQIDYRRQSNGAVVSVKDNGLGIDPKHIPRLTERFYRVDPARSVTSGGTGLGLAIVKHVLLRHNAELVIASKVGRGSEFACHFPEAMVAVATAAATTVAAATVAPSGVAPANKA